MTLIGFPRMIPRTVVAGGVLPLAWFLFRTYPKLNPQGIREEEPIWDRPDFKNP